MRKPIIIAHRGNPQYLRYTLKQAKHYNDDVILLGDKENAAFSDIVEHHLLDDFSTSEELSCFRDLYKHMSTNHYQFEKICFERWFQIVEFLESDGIQSFFHIDSDILLYSNISIVLEKVIGEYEAAYNIISQQYEEYLWKSSAHTSFWKTKFLKGYCSFVNNSYKNGFNELEKKWDWHREKSVIGGVSDMSLFYLFYLNNKNSIYNLLKPTTENICFDYNINGSLNNKQDEYKTKISQLGTVIKDVRIDNSAVFCYNQMMSKEIQFANLHFQGIAKYLIFKYLNEEVPLFEKFINTMLMRWIYLKLKIKKILNL
jgi:hypothetical protein